MIYVKDNGRGIPADRLADVMQPFVQVSDSYARDLLAVSALALAICKSLAEGMGGRIEITQANLVTVRRYEVFLPRWKSG